MNKLQQIRRARKKGKPTLNTPDLQKRILARGKKNRPANVTGIARAQSILQRGKTAKGLALLNQLAQTATTNKRKAKITALIGDSEFRQAHYPEALLAYQAASTKAANHIREWLRPAIGELVCFLQLADMESAAVKARAIWQKAQSSHQSFLTTQGNAAATIRANGKFIVAQRPHRASVVASRLGQLFLHEGEIGLAQEFFDNAITVNPHGSARSRQGLAEMALRAGDNSEAERKAREALLVGRYQAKTIGVWPVLIAARAGLGLVPLDNGLKSALLGIPKGGVRSRAVLSVVAELRKQSAVGWEALANQWLAQQATQYPIIAVEIRKLLLSSSRTQNLPTGTLTTALLSQTQALSLKEFIAVAKESVRQAIKTGQPSTASGLASQGVAQFGPKTIGKINHALAFAAMESGDNATARQLLNINVQSVAHHLPEWSKSLSALARLELADGEKPIAASHYELLAGQSQVPLEFKMRSRILAIRIFHELQNKAKVASHLQILGQELASTEDYRVLLDMGRQLKLKFVTESLADTTIARATQKVSALLDGQKNPGLYLNLLFELTRRQFYDYFDFDSAVDNWESLSAAKRDWLWSETSIFWEYLSLLIRCYSEMEQADGITNILTHYLDDSMTPLVGKCMLNAAYADHLVANNQMAEAFVIFEKIVLLSPTQYSAATSSYWLALRARKRGETDASQNYAVAVRQCLGNQPGLLSDWKLDCQALFILHNNDLEFIGQNFPRYRSAPLQQWLESQQRDQQLIPI